jgi:translation initiation factor 1
MSKQRSGVFPPPGEPAAESPFAALSGLRGTLPAGPAADAAAAAPTRANPLAGKLVLNRERKGRGGKTVTLLRGVALQGEPLAAFARELRQALGTGGSVEDDAIVLAGDQAERAAAWLRERGAARVVIGN